MSKFKYLFLALFLVSPNLYADVVSLTSNYVAGQSDVVSKLNSDRIGLTNSVNNIEGATASSTVQSYGQVKGDTISEENMADDANPRIRTNDGASCADLVVSGLLPTTTTATLTGSIPAGVAYPDGYYVEKTTATPKVFTASKDTYLYIQTNGTFYYDEQANGASDPGARTNAARLAKIVTDGTEITSVTDQRTTSCTSGPFSVIKDATNEASLDDLLKNGSPIVKDYDNGWIQGVHVEYKDSTNFTITPGSAYINGKYRSVSVDVTVPTTADTPSTGVSGIDTGSLAASTTYNIFTVADQDTVKTFSVTYSASATPAGCTNYRKIGTINTNEVSVFSTSSDVTTVHAVNNRQLIKGWICFNGTGTIAINDSYNVSGLADNATGDYTVTWNKDFDDTNYCAISDCEQGQQSAIESATKAAGSVVVNTGGWDSGAAVDSSQVYLMAIGDQ